MAHEQSVPIGRKPLVEHIVHPVFKLAALHVAAPQWRNLVPPPLHVSVIDRSIPAEPCWTQVLNGSQRNVHRFRNFTVTQLLLVKQGKGLPIVISNSRQGQRHFFRQIFSGLNIGQAVGNLFRQNLRGGTTFSVGKRRPAAVTRNCQQPRFKISSCVPAMKVFEHPDKCFLSHIFGILPLPQHAVAEAENLAAKPFHKGQHGPLVTGQTTSDDGRSSSAESVFIMPLSRENTFPSAGRFQTVGLKGELFLSQLFHCNGRILLNPAN